MKINFNIIDILLILISVILVVTPQYITYINLNWIPSVGFLILLIGLFHLLRSNQKLYLETRKDYNSQRDIQNNLINILNELKGSSLAKLEKIIDHNIKQANIHRSFESSLKTDISELTESQKDALNNELQKLAKRLEIGRATQTTNLFSKIKKSQEVFSKNQIDSIMSFYESFENFQIHNINRLNSFSTDLSDTSSELMKYISEELFTLYDQNNKDLYRIENGVSELQIILKSEFEKAIHNQKESIDQILSSVDGVSTLIDSEVDNLKSNQINIENLTTQISYEITAKINDTNSSIESIIIENLNKSNNSLEKIRDEILNVDRNILNSLKDSFELEEKNKTEILSEMSKMLNLSKSDLESSIKKSNEKSIESFASRIMQVKGDLIKSDLRLEKFFKRIHKDNVESILGGLHKFEKKFTKKSKANSITQKEIKSFLSKSSTEINNSFSSIRDNLTSYNKNIFEYLSNNSVQMDLFNKKLEKEAESITQNFDSIIKIILESNESINSDITKLISNKSKQSLETSFQHYQLLSQDLNKSNEKIIANQHDLEEKLLDNYELFMNNIIGMLSQKLKQSSELLLKQLLEISEGLYKSNNKVSSGQQALEETLLINLKSYSSELKGQLITLLENQDLSPLISQILSNNQNLLKTLESYNASTNNRFELKSKQLLEYFSVYANEIKKSLSALVEEKINYTEQQNETNNLLTDLMSNQSDLIDNYRYTSNNLLLQIEALLKLYNTLKIKNGLPNLNGWAILPDLATYISNLIITSKPETVVSIGSGSSDVIIARSLQLVGKGKLISLEHEKKFFDETKRILNKHDVEEMVDLVYAPFKYYDIKGKQWLWYDYNPNGKMNNIDLLIVDGPPKDVQDDSRYPAVPILLKYLKSGSVVILDDGKREEEKQIAESWAKDFDMDIEYINSAKGTLKLTKH